MALLTSSRRGANLDHPHLLALRDFSRSPRNVATVEVDLDLAHERVIELHEGHPSETLDHVL